LNGLFSAGGRAQRFIWSPDHFMDYDPERGFYREFTAADGRVNTWDMPPVELEAWFARNRTADFVSCDWVVTR
jgi:hypothetical protein